MKKLKKQAVALCVMTLVWSLALGTTGFFWAGNYAANAPNEVLDFWFRFFFMSTPTVAVLTLVTVARLKVQ